MWNVIYQTIFEQIRTIRKLSPVSVILLYLRLTGFLENKVKDNPFAISGPLIN